MSRAVRIRRGRVSDPTAAEFGETMANTAGAAELAIRAAVGAVGVQAVTALVREHPVVSLLIATGVGYWLGRRWWVRHDQASRPKDAD
jgi:hypothetical protein